MNGTLKTNGAKEMKTVKTVKIERKPPRIEGIGYGARKMANIGKGVANTIRRSLLVMPFVIFFAYFTALIAAYMANNIPLFYLIAFGGGIVVMGGLLIFSNTSNTDDDFMELHDGRGYGYWDITEEDSPENED